MAVLDSLPQPPPRTAADRVSYATLQAYDGFCIAFPSTRRSCIHVWKARLRLRCGDLTSFDPTPDPIRILMATDYSEAAEFYDLAHAGDKDYAAEALVLAALIREHNPQAKQVLDVACGTGRHAAELTKLGFAVDGIDLEPTFITTAAARCPLGRFRVADMVTFDIPERYDAVLCLFSAIGYVRELDALHMTLQRFAAHLRPAGLVIVDPWFEPGQLTDRHVDAVSRVSDDLALCRLTRTFIEGRISRLEFDYLVGRAGSVERRSETHTLGLFTEAEIIAAFRNADLAVERRRGLLRKRGVYLGARTLHPSSNS